MKNSAWATSSAPPAATSTARGLAASAQYPATGVTTNRAAIDAAITNPIAPPERPRPASQTGSQARPAAFTVNSVA